MLKDFPSFFNLLGARPFNRASHLDQRQVYLIQLRLNEMDGEWRSEGRVSSVKHEPRKTQQLGDLWILHLEMRDVGHLLRIHFGSARVGNHQRYNLYPVG